MQDASSTQTKQNYKPNQQQQDSNLIQPCPGEEKPTNKKILSTNFTLYEDYTNHWTNFRRAESKRKKELSIEAWETETSNTISLKENNETAEK